MSVPTFRPEDGADLHSHSPRRKAVLKTSKSAGYQGPLNPEGLSSGFFGNQSLSLSFLPQAAAAATGSSMSFPDPFTESNRCFNWSTNPGGWESVDDATYFQMTGKSRWPEDSNEPNREVFKRKELSDESMPDYLPTKLESLPMHMHLSGPSLEDDPMSLKVPTNTPTTGAADDLQGEHYSVTSTIPSDLANSLTHSLLNQPFPQPHNIPFPSSEIKSRKENRHLTIAGSNPSSTQSTPHAEHTETRKFSQGRFSLGNMGMGFPMPMRHESASINSPGSETVVAASESRRASTGDYGSNVFPNQNPLNDSLANPLGMGFVNAGTKRTRNFTPASAKAIDEEDEPRRASPHVRMSSFGGDRTNGA